MEKIDKRSIAVRKPNNKLICGFGYIGEGKYCSYSLGYQVWITMLHRCYDSKEPRYANCSVDEKWHNFQNFAEWYEKYYHTDFELDKDILVKGNRIYSESTCCLVPGKINISFVKQKGRRGLYPIGVKKIKDEYRGQFKHILCRDRKQYMAHVRLENGRIRIGAYYTIEEAFEAYKNAKEKFLKRLALKWRDQITQQVFDALWNYKVEITD